LHALFDADTTSNAKELGDESNLVRGLDLDTEFACMMMIYSIAYIQLKLS
jgi:hypothetical protein